MITDRIKVYGGYDGHLKQMCKAIKKYTTSDFHIESVELFGRMIPPNSLIIPMPSHTGEPSASLCSIACAVAYQYNCDVFPYLQCVPHYSNYEVKKRGEIPEEPSMFIAEGLELPKDKDIYIIDNVISSGATARAALKAVPNAIVVALARDKKYYLKRKDGDIYFVKH